MKLEEDAESQARRIKQMYESFRDILACNDATLQLIADIEDRLSGRIPFSFSQMVRQIRRGILDVYVMVRNFNELFWQRHPDLFDALRKINNEFEANLASLTGTVTGPFVIPLTEIRAADAPLVGKKMAQLGEIRNVVGLEVPDGFAITTAAFSRFMNRDGLKERAEKIEELTEIFGQRVVAEACRELQQKILDAPMLSELEGAIWNAYKSLAGDGKVLMAVRSSGVGEDDEASHAGLYCTELNVGEDWLLEAYKRVLASTFGLGPVQYRLKYGLASTDSLMAAGCLRMIESKCRGIMFSRSFDDREADKVVISAYTGLADCSRGKEADAEEIIVSSGKTVDGESLDCLSSSHILKLAEAARVLESHFGNPQDIEWVLSNDDRICILQSRSMVFVTSESVEDSSGIAETQEPILTGGATAHPGIGSGSVFVLRAEGDLDRFPDGAVLISRAPSPHFSLVMDRCAAIVTEAGSPIGHMAILAREFQVPTIVGMKGIVGLLQDGRQITVDSKALRIYEGILAGANRRKESNPLTNAPAVRKLKRIAQFVTPLQLFDITSPEFAPSNARSLHDIIRFVHEKTFEAMFYFGDRTLALNPASVSLEENLPFKVLVFDMGGGLSDRAAGSRRIVLADVVSLAMKAFLEGLSDQRINWNAPRAVSVGGFLSVLGENIACLPPEELGIGRPSFAVVSEHYMNFSTKAGYHFNTVDTYCSQNLNKNYIHFRFEGGAADETRRERRCKFILLVLNALDFKTQSSGDILVGRIDKYDQESIRRRLLDLGRLTLCCRQLDMLMRSDSSPEFFAKAFLAGELERF